jgi:hypothetical protein
MIASRIDLVPGDKPAPMAGYASLFVSALGVPTVLFPDGTELVLGSEGAPIGQFPVGTAPTNKIYAQRNYGGF